MSWCVPGMRAQVSALKTWLGRDPTQPTLTQSTQIVGSTLVYFSIQGVRYSSQFEGGPWRGYAPGLRASDWWPGKLMVRSLCPARIVTLDQAQPKSFDHCISEDNLHCLEELCFE